MGEKEAGKTGEVCLGKGTYSVFECRPEVPERSLRQHPLGSWRAHWEVRDRLSSCCEEGGPARPTGASTSFHRADRPFKAGVGGDSLGPSGKGIPPLC